MKSFSSLASNEKQVVQRLKDLLTNPPALWYLGRRDIVPSIITLARSKLAAYIYKNSSPDLRDALDIGKDQLLKRNENQRKESWIHFTPMRKNSVLLGFFKLAGSRSEQLQDFEVAVNNTRRILETCMMETTTVGPPVQYSSSYRP